MEYRWYGWIVFGIFWGVSSIIVLRHWYRDIRPKGFKFSELFESWPYGTDRRSPVPWLAYIYACISQFSPVGAISRFASERYSLRYIDSYILSWGALALLALQMPDKIGFFIPLFIWRFLEYTSIILYQRFFGAGHPKRMETVQDPYRLNYRVLLIDLINYLIFALMFAAYYLGNADFIFGPDKETLASATDAFYFSVVTMATLGYGDFRPLGHVRVVAALEVLFGLFMIVIIIGVLIGERRLYIRREEKEE